ncbi:hypothetical protein [Mycobacterium sp.]|uniref:hypothetical protein n=1 Tax=Mycobacterium sp. TaxID=1785 RepID=UPI003F97EF96
MAAHPGIAAFEPSYPRTGKSTLAWAHDTGADLAKAANFTILRQNPYTVDARRLNEIEVIGTVYGGRWFPAATS